MATPRTPIVHRQALRQAAAALALLAAVATPIAAQAQDPDPAKPSVLVASSAQRRAYLAKAIVWREKALPSSEAIIEGPPGNPGGSRAEVNPPEGIPCTYESGSASMGGKTPKFTCRTPDGRTIRVKYFDGDPAKGNREVFAEVVATRLFWALGFPADRVYPITVNCKDCPADPMHGTGPRASREFLGVTEPHFAGELILSRANPDQGWKFGEFAQAIASLPDGPEKAARRTQFDALTLLAVFIQHGDRKAPNQRLVCLGGLDTRAGDVHSLDDDGPAQAVPALFERSGMTACAAPAALIQDLGATFGSSGIRTTQGNKISLSGWARRAVFLPPKPADVVKGVRVCRGDIIAAFDAGQDTGEEPVISEAGRALLDRLLGTLTDAHIRALFEAARVDQLGERAEWRDPETKQTHTGIDAWVAAFKHKREQIITARCGG